MYNVLSVKVTGVVVAQQLTFLPYLYIHQWREVFQNGHQGATNTLYQFISDQHTYHLSDWKLLLTFLCACILFNVFWSIDKAYKFHMQKVWMAQKYVNKHNALVILV